MCIRVDVITDCWGNGGFGGYFIIFSFVLQTGSFNKSACDMWSSPTFLPSSPSHSYLFLVFHRDEQNELLASLIRREEVGRSAEGHMLRRTTKKILNNCYIEGFDRSFMGCGPFNNVEKGSLNSLTSKVSFQIRRKSRLEVPNKLAYLCGFFSKTGT